MVAVIGDSAQTPSIELHRALGFRMVGTVENVGYKFDRWLDSVMMQRALGAGATHAALIDGQTRDQTRAPLSSTRSTRSSSWPRRTIRPVADTTL